MTAADIPKIQAIEKAYYDGYFVPDEILTNWIKNAGDNFWIIEEGEKLLGYIFTERLDGIKAIPYIHKVEDNFTPTGKYIYISEIGVLNKDFDLLQQLFEKVLESAELNTAEAIVWVTGENEKGHDSVERKMISANDFEKFKHFDNWEYWPGKFCQDHWIYIKWL